MKHDEVAKDKAIVYAASHTRGRLMVGLIGLGVLARVVVIGLTSGSNDMGTWTRFASSIRSNGLWSLYDTDVLFNHPPIMGLMAAGLHWVSDVTSIPFPYLFKLPMLIGDIFVLWLLWTIWSKRSPEKTLMAMAVFACNPVSIFVTAHHGNTDSLVAAFCLLAARQHSRGAMFSAGLALAAAGNVKIVVAICIPALLMLIKERAQLWRILAGGMFGAIPFAIALALGGSATITNVFLYDSAVGQWGMSGINVPGYRGFGRFVIVVALIGFAVYGRRLAWSPYKAVALSFAVFLAVTGGWGVQYHVWLVPALAAGSIAWSVRYAAFVGTFVTLLYLNYMQWDFPFETQHSGGVYDEILFIGLLAWAWMVWWMFKEARNEASPRW